MVNQEIFDRNVRLVSERMEKQIETSLKKGNDYIDKELNNPLDFFIRPFVKMFYNSFARKDIEAGSRDNIKVCIKTAKEIAMNEKTPVNEIIDKYFPKYLKGDQTARNLKKTHRNYQWCVDNTKRIFRAQVIPLVEMLKYEGDVETYDELAVKTFKDPDLARKILTEQLIYMEEGIRKVETDPTILNVPTGKDIILRVLKRGFKDTREELISDVDVIFNRYAA